MNKKLIFAGIVLIVGIGFNHFIRSIRRIKLPPHLLGHTAMWIPDFVSKEHFESLNEIIRDMAEFPSNLDADLKTGGFVAKHEHIGEATPISENGKCDHPFLVPNLDKTLCILPQRVDIGRHFVLTGGPDAIREPYNKMISRLTSFGRYMFNVVDQYPTVKELFDQDSFQNAAKSICPPDQQVLDPFQFNFIMQVPGQTVATHVDGVYFWGATRREFPQWLLACMLFSNLFADKFIHQVQVVGYLHDWVPSDSKESSGEFIYYNENNALGKTMKPLPRSGNLVDGTKTVHAAQVYRKEVDAPTLDKDQQNTLQYVGNESWHLKVGDEVRYVYPHNDLRISVVYRARCFASEDTKERFYRQSDADSMQLEEILDTLKADIAKKSSKYTREKLDALPILELAFVLMDNYIAYPLPAAETALIPFNYCALPKLLPWTAPLVNALCA